MRMPILKILIFLALANTANSQTNIKLETSDLLSDTHLQKQVEVNISRIYLNDFLKLISSQCGENITINEELLLSGEQLCLRVPKTSVNKVMNALCSLISCKGGEWHWYLSKVNNTNHYQLAPSNGALSIKDTLRKKMKDRIGTQIGNLIDLSRLTSEQRKEQHKSLAEAFGSSDNRLLNIWAEHTEFWFSVGLFSYLADQQKTAVYNGETVERLITTFPETIQEGIYKYYTLASLDSNGQKILPDFVRFQLEKSDPKSRSSMFKIMATVGKESSSRSRPISGMLDIYISEYVTKNWILNSDRSTDDRDKKFVPFDKIEKPLWLKFSTPQTLRYVQVSTFLDVPMIALIGYENLNSRQVFSSTPKQSSWYTELQVLNENLLKKWNGNILLLSHADWFYQNDEIYSYRNYKPLHSSFLRNQNILNLDTLIYALQTFSTSQLERLQQEFPILNSVIGAGALEFCLENPSALTQDGCELTEEVLKSKCLKKFPFSLNGATKIRVIGIVESKGIYSIDLQFFRPITGWLTTMRLHQPTPLTK